MKHFIYELSKAYPQLVIPIKEGISKSEEYKDIALRGKQSDYPITFSLSPKDSFETVNTKMGDVNVITMFKREDFVHMVRCLGGKCEPIDIPDSTGAMAIFGLNNWNKVREGLEDYKDSIIILSSGNYSNVSNKDVKSATNNEIDISDEEWTNKSITIRKYHEITHFVMRKEYPNNIQAIRDEIIADMVGIVAGFNYYDTRLAKLFLGLEGNEYRKGGRLENYTKNYLEEKDNVIKMINKLADLTKDKYDYQKILDNIGDYMAL